MIGRENIPIYLVSLAEDDARREKLKLSFPRYYESFIRVDAVDGRKLLAKEYFDFAQPLLRKHKRLMTPGELGCSLSHIKALKSFLGTASESALIIEDDVIGDDKALEGLKAVAGRLPSGGIVICGGQEGLENRNALGKREGDGELWEVARFSYAYVYRTCCYLISRDAAHQVVSTHAQGVMIADWWGHLLGGSSVRMFYKNVLSHPKELSGSQIQSERSVISYQVGSKNNLSTARLLEKISFSQLKVKFARVVRDFKRLFLVVQGYKRIEH